MLNHDPLKRPKNLVVRIYYITITKTKITCYCANDNHLFLCITSLLTKQIFITKINERKSAMIRENIIS